MVVMPKKRPPIRIGDRFSRLTVIDHAPYKGRIKQWLCRCECGKITTANSSYLNMGKKRSCGCLRREMSTLKAATWRRTHSMSHKRTYRIWHGMLNRCRNKKT